MNKKLEKPSARPSIKPSTAEPAPTDASSTGIAVVAISWPMSENILAKPIPTTLRFRQRTFGSAANGRLVEDAGGFCQDLHIDTISHEVSLRTAEL